MLKVLMKSLKWITISLVVLVVTLSVLIWSITFHPPALQKEGVVNQTNTPVLESGQLVKNT